MKDRAYLHKDFTELTEEDLQEMAEDYRNMEAEKTELDNRLNEIQEQEAELDKQREAKAVEFAAAAVNSAIAQILNELDLDAMKDALIAIVDAFQEYAKENGGTVQGFFRDPDLPEILQQVRDRAKEILLEQIKKRHIPPKDFQKYTQEEVYGPLIATPSAAIIQLLLRIINSNGEELKASKGNRHEKITVKHEGTRTTYIRERKGAAPSKYEIRIEQAAEVMKKTGKTFARCLAYSLEQMTRQNFPREVVLPLQELVDRGSYTRVDNAKRAMQDFFETQKKITLGGTEKRGRRTIFEEGGVLFYHYKYRNGIMTFAVNDNFNWDLIAAYFTVFPRFAYALSNNAFLLVWYIFYLARQNTDKIKAGKPFTISLEAVRAYIGLPDPAEVQNRKYRQFIMTPIEDAIEEIEEALRTLPEAKDLAFTITPYGTDTSSIEEYLQGYLEIGLSGAFAETFTRIADNTEEKRKAWEKAKLNAAAKLQVIEERKQGAE